MTNRIRKEIVKLAKSHSIEEDDLFFSGEDNVSIVSENGKYFSTVIRFFDEEVEKLKADFYSNPDKYEPFSVQAKNLVCGDRNQQYGPPTEDYLRISKVWSGMLVDILKPGCEITTEKALLMMVALKLCRECTKHKDDNVIDAHGYLDCLEWKITGNKPE